MKSRLRAPRVWWKKLPLRRLVRALSALYLLPDGKSWVGPVCNDRSGSGVRPLDDHLLQSKELALTVSSGILDDTVETSL